MSCQDQKYMKVGVCKGDDIEKRLKTLQTGNPHLITIEWFEERKNANKAENYVHHQLSKYRVRPNSEWFEGVTVHQIRRTLLLFLDQE